MTTSALVPAVLPFAIDAHPFLIDPDYERQTVQVIRQQADASTEPGEQSLTPLGLWRRSQESWHHGAGQDFLDGKTDQPADPHRFRSSKGIDCWTRGQISLLHPTFKSWATTNTNLHLAVSYAGSLGPFCLSVADGTEVYFATVPFGGLNSLALGTGVGWTATNATIAVASTTRFTLTATSAAAVSATSLTGASGVPVDPSRDYKVTVSSFYVSGGSGRLVQIAVNWYTAAGALISTTPTITGTDDTGPSVAGSATTTVTPPWNAAFASVTVSWSTNFASGEIHRVHSVNIAPADTVGSVSPDNWAAHTINAGQAAQTVQSLATNGTHIWAALGTSGIHRTLAITETSTADVPAAPGAGQIHLVGWANGFLLAAGSTTSTTGKNTLWSVTDPLGAPALSVIKTHPNSSFEWTGIGPGRNCVYAWGNSGGNGEVYKITFDANTGTLSTAASFATYLPDGETIHALQFYAGGIIMGTGKGVRLGQADGTGNIDYGPLIDTEWPVRCLEPQGRWCWFGWTKYDDSNSGLGRIDLGYFTDTLTPAWASDLMTKDASDGDVISCVTFSPHGYSLAQRPPVRVFTVAGKGVYIEDPSWYLLLGSVKTGKIRFSTSEIKSARYFDMRYTVPDLQQTNFTVYLATDSGSFVALSAPTLYTASATTYTLTQSGESFEFQVYLHSDRAASPVVSRWTLKALPLPLSIDETFTVKIHMKSTVETTAGDGQPYHIDVPTEVAYLKTLERNRTIVEMQLGDETHDVYVLSSKFTGDHWESPTREFAEGIYELTCQTVRG